MTETTNTRVSGATLDRAALEEHLAQPVRSFDNCSFDDADLSRLDLQGCTFERCTFVDASLFAAKLARSSWLRCRGGGADFEWWMRSTRASMAAT
ncbi:pentapeptide repeat-containing protein [Duganella sp. Dugasp56]|uniref:pentapeptide repeat-containing protein n=1 Tax=Duganella sp. Dugasp56 TaxID=3243046 RepID=UPI0039AFF746